MHHCLGSSLAQIDGQETFNTLAERLPALALATDVLTYAPPLNMRSLTCLPVVLA